MLWGVSSETTELQHELAQERLRLEQLAEARADQDRAADQLARLARHLDERLTRSQRSPKGPRGWAKRRLLSTTATPEESAEVDELRASSLFDPVWYFSTYPEVADTGLSAALHYLRLGAAQGKDPGPDFSTNHYASRHPMLARSKVNPLLNHLRTGQ